MSEAPEFFITLQEERSQGRVPEFTLPHTIPSWGKGVVSPGSLSCWDESWDSSWDGIFPSDRVRREEFLPSLEPEGPTFIWDLQPLSECIISISLDLQPWIDIHGLISQFQDNSSASAHLFPPQFVPPSRNRLFSSGVIVLFSLSRGSRQSQDPSCSPHELRNQEKKTPLFPGMLSSSSTGANPRILIRNGTIITTSFSTDKLSLQGFLALHIHEFPLLLNLAFLGPFHGDKFHEPPQARSLI